MLDCPIYIATPYTSPHPYIMRERFHAALKALTACYNAGIAAISPIVQSHPCVEHGYCTGVDWATWADIDKALIRACSEVWVIMLDGWENSVGIDAEIKYARSIGIPVCFVEPDDLPRYCEQRKAE
jgi:hypothetical protein